VATKTSSVSDAIVSYSIDVLYHNLVEEVVLKKRKKNLFSTYVLTLPYLSIVLINPSDESQTRKKSGSFYCPHQKRPTIEAKETCSRSLLPL
jgi:hypothetical protein